MAIVFSATKGKAVFKNGYVIVPVAFTEPSNSYSFNREYSVALPIPGNWPDTDINNDLNGLNNGDPTLSNVAAGAPAPPTTPVQPTPPTQDQQNLAAYYQAKGQFITQAQYEMFLQFAGASGRTREGNGMNFKRQNKRLE